jgi:hypothetical protein
MNETNKKTLLKDINDFLNKEARDRYAKWDISYQREFLLYESSETRKSSFSLFVTECFKLNIYVLNLLNVNDESLSSLFA